MAFSGPRNNRIVHFVSKHPTSVLECLQSNFRVEPEQAKALIGLGAVYLGKNQRVLQDQKITPKDYLRIHLQPKRFPVSEVDWRGIIVHEDRDFLVVNKPSGIPVHATLDNLTENVLHQLRLLFDGELYVTQRLDVPVSGLMVFARNPDFQKRFNFWLAERRVDKRYTALVARPLPLGKHVHFMEPSERSPKRVEPTEKPGWQRCELTIHGLKPVPTVNGETLTDPVQQLMIELHTGRTHQIRAQVSALGAPVLGDKLYRSRWGRYRGATSGESIALESVRISFPRHGGKIGADWAFSIEPSWNKA